MSFSRRQQRRQHRNALVVKVQLEQAPNPGASAFIYDKARKIEHVVTDYAQVEMLKGRLRGDQKGYFRARFVNGTLDIDERIPEQEW